MSQPLIDEPCGVSDHIFYMAQWLKHLGFHLQKAACASAPLDEHKRPAWRTKTGPQILRAAKAPHTLLLFGAAVRFPRWGTLTYTWARRGQPPTVKPSGTRQGDQVFGLLDYVTEHFFSHGQDGRLNSAASLALRQRVLAQTSQPLVLVQGGAKYHPSAATTACCAQQAARLQVCQLPTDAPDYNPMEKRWQKIKQQDTPRHYFPPSTLSKCEHFPLNRSV
jgi:hypothetical protein